MPSRILSFDKDHLCRIGKVCLMVVLMALCTGCRFFKKSHSTPPPTPVEPRDPFNVLIRDIDDVYTRPGTNIRINLMKSKGGDHNFTNAEKALLVKALDSLTNQELIDMGGTNGYLLQPQPQIPNGFLYVVRVTNSNNPLPGAPATVVFFNFTEPTATRAFDPNLGNEFLKAAGFPNKRVTPLTTASEEISPESDWRPPVLPRVLPKAPGGQLLTSEQHVTIVSPELPTTYVPIISPEGLQAIREDYDLSDYKKLTVEDQIRPHGRPVVISPSGSRN